MIDIFITIERADVGARSHATAMRAALLAVALRHMQTTIGKHFRNVPETQPGGAYGFKLRSQYYVRRKMRAKAKFPWGAEADQPLTFTGKLKRFVKNNAIITATQYQARIRLRAPHILKPQQWKELTAISQQEVDDYTLYAAEVYQRTLKELGARKSRRQVA